MECTILEKYLKENEGSSAAVPAALQQHLAECRDCHDFHWFVSVLNLQQGSLEKAPVDLLPTIEKKIHESIKLKNREPSFIFRPLLKPAFAVLSVVLVAAATYTYLDGRNIGSVENLSDRFKLAQFENIKAGDMLYAGDNTIAAIRLKGKSKLQIHQNTIVKVKGALHITLSRGEISLQAGDKELQIATPNGLVTARSADAKIQTIARLENGAVLTETTCMVFKGNLSIKSSLKETILDQGQKAVIAENGRITHRQQLTAAESASEKSVAVQQKIFAAVELLCDCIFACNYTPDKRGNHLELFGREVDKNEFKVRVFWQAKGLKELVFASLNENTTTCSTKKRRIRA